VISFGSWKDGPRGPVIVLTDGSRIAGNVVAANAQQIEIEPFNAESGPVVAALKRLRAICFDPPRDERTRDRWWATLMRSARESAANDALHLRDGSIVHGTIEALNDETTVRFRTRGHKKVEDLSLEPVRAIVWGEERPPPVASQAGGASIGLNGLYLR